MFDLCAAVPPDKWSVGVDGEMPGNALILCQNERLSAETCTYCSTQVAPLKPAYPEGGIGKRPDPAVHLDSPQTAAQPWHGCCYRTRFVCPGHRGLW